MRVSSLDIKQPEPTEGYTDFEGCVRWHSLVTLDATAREICSLEFYGLGDVVDVPLGEAPGPANP
ncbi:MAG: hypothetical protein QOF01_3078 [Thermomicrobiales bacterium]|nr:hypothetical protein [Thermomicrobiales bacterium]